MTSEYPVSAPTQARKRRIYVPHSARLRTPANTSWVLDSCWRDLSEKPRRLKFQVTNRKSQTREPQRGNLEIWNLEFGIYLDLGFWNLEFRRISREVTVG